MGDRDDVPGDSWFDADAAADDDDEVPVFVNKYRVAAKAPASKTEASAPAPQMTALTEEIATVALVPPDGRAHEAAAGSTSTSSRDAAISGTDTAGNADIIAADAGADDAEAANEDDEVGVKDGDEGAGESASASASRPPHPSDETGYLDFSLRSPWQSLKRLPSPAQIQPASCQAVLLSLNPLKFLLLGT
jgi:hypothetical protein